MPLRLFIILLVFIFGTSIKSYSQHSSPTTANQIDSLLKNVQTQKTGKKLQGSNGGSENYHYRTDGSIYLIAVYRDTSFTLFYFIDSEPVKVTYGERKHKKRNHYYFQKRTLIRKLETPNLAVQDDQILIETADILLSKS